MPTGAASAIAGEVRTGDDRKGPVPLRPFGWLEWVSVGLLVALGILLTVGTLLWFGLSHSSGGGLASKTVVTTGTGPTQRVEETDYSDTVVIFALTAGAAFVLVGALYGRIRDVTLGALKIELGDDGTSGNQPGKK